MWCVVMPGPPPPCKQQQDLCVMTSLTVPLLWQHTQGRRDVMHMIADRRGQGK